MLRPRPRPDLDAIDRELDQLGKPREDVAQLVAKYAGQGRSTPPFDQMLAMLSESEAEPAAAAPRSDVAPSEDADDPDHDDFELLVDDADMDSVEEDDELESVA
jgi:hypothetical protein